MAIQMTRYDKYDENFTNTRFDASREILQDIIERRMKDVDISVFTDFLNIIFTTRFYLTMDFEGMEMTWNRIRINETLVDFILNVTMEFVARTNCEVVNFEALCEDVATAMGIVNNPGGCLDHDIKDQLSSGHNGFSALKMNPWFLMLYLSETIISRDILKDD